MSQSDPSTQRAHGLRPLDSQTGSGAEVSLAGACALVDARGTLLWASESGLSALRTLLPQDRRAAQSGAIPSLIPDAWKSALATLAKGGEGTVQLRSPDRPLGAVARWRGPHRQGALVQFELESGSEGPTHGDQRIALLAIPLPAILVDTEGAVLRANARAESLLERVGVAGQPLPFDATALVGTSDANLTQSWGSGIVNFRWGGTDDTHCGSRLIVLEEQPEEDWPNRLARCAEGHPDTPASSSQSAATNATSSAVARAEVRVASLYTRIESTIGGLEARLELEPEAQSMVGWTAIAARLSRIDDAITPSEPEPDAPSDIEAREDLSRLGLQLREATQFSDALRHLARDTQNLIPSDEESHSREQSAEGTSALIGSLHHEALQARQDLDEFMGQLEAWLLQHQVVIQQAEQLDEIAYESSLLALQTSTQSALNREPEPDMLGGLAEQWRGLSSRLGDAARDVRRRIQEDARGFERILRKARTPLVTTDRIIELSGTASDRLDAEADCQNRVPREVEVQQYLEEIQRARTAMDERLRQGIKLQARLEDRLA